MRRVDVIPRAPVTDVDFALPEFFQVKATKQGFIHWLRNPGDVFVIPRHLYSPTWMQIMDRDLATIVRGDAPAVKVIGMDLAYSDDVTVVTQIRRLK